MQANMHEAKSKLSQLVDSVIGNFSKTGGLLTSNHFVLHDLRQRREHVFCESVLKIMPE